MKTSVEVFIAGEKYQVRSEADATYVRKLAEFVNEHIESVQARTQVVSTPKLLVLAAMNLADELFQERKKRANFKEKVRAQSKQLLDFLEKEERKFLAKTGTVAERVSVRN